MRILDRYVLRELMIPFPYCLGGFMLFWISSDLIDKIDDFRQDRLTRLDIAEYYFRLLPDFLVLLLPVVLLLALLYAMTTHARHQEFTAMRAAGWSLWRICAPYFAVGLACTVTVYGLNEFLAPEGREEAERVRRRHHAGGAEGREWQRELTFRNERDQRFWRIQAFNVDTGEMRKPFVEWLRPDGTSRQLLAEKGEYVEGGWVFHDGKVFDMDPGTDKPVEAFELLKVAELRETPEVIRSESKVSQLNSMRAARKVHLTVSEILHYKYLHPELRPREAALLGTQLHARLAHPWTCAVVVLIAAPFGAASGRRNVFVGVASSIFICFLYSVLQQLGMGLGTGGHLPPALAAWLPNALFGTVGAVMTARSR